MANVKEYSVEEKLSSLVNLQKVDSKLDEIRILKGELPMEVADLEDEIQGLHARQMRIEEEINGITEFIAQKKEAIKDAEALLKKYEKDSENVKNNREFEAINKEIEMQQLEVKLCEKHIKDANEEIAEKAQALQFSFSYEYENVTASGIFETTDNLSPIKYFGDSYDAYQILGRRYSIRS